MAKIGKWQGESPTEGIDKMESVGVGEGAWFGDAFLNL
jgi:hypothetical protein